MPKYVKKNKKYLIILSVILFLVTGIFCANICSIAFIASSTQNTSDIRTNEFDLYLLSTAKSKLEKSAQELAKDYQPIGAGGYIWKNDEYFYVISSAYINKNDAQLVKNNLETNSNILCEIIPVHFNSYKLGISTDNESKKVLQRAVNIFYANYLQLFDIAVSLDTAVYNEISARLAINSTHSNLNSAIADFKTIFANSDNAEIQKLSKALVKAQSISTKLASGIKVNKEQTYSSLIKFRYTELLATLFELTNNT